MLRVRLVGACVVAAGALVVSVPISAAPAPGVGAPAPRASVQGVPSFPFGRSGYSRPSIAEDRHPLGPASVGSLPPGYSLVDAVVANTNTSLGRSDTFADWEPSLAVNPANPNQLAAYTFSSCWLCGGGDAAVWYSSNGGSTWSKDYTLAPPSPFNTSNGCPCDVTVDYDRGSRLFLSALNETSNGGDLFTGATALPSVAADWHWYSPSGVTQQTDLTNAGMDDADQPWLRLVRDPAQATQDDAYVAYGDFSSPYTIHVATAPGSAPPQFARDVQVGAMGCCVNPGARIAGDPSTGAVYLLWQYATGINGDGSTAVEYALIRSTDGGVTWSLNGSDSGIVVASGNSDQPWPKFGGVNALLGGVDAIAVAPAGGDVYTVYGTKDPDTGMNRLAIRSASSDGAGGVTIGPEQFVTGQVQAALPSVAVASNGTIGVLYDTFDGTSLSGYPVFTAHLAQSADHGSTFHDTPLVTFTSPATPSGVDDRQRVLGDYQQLRSVGNTFFGILPANGAAFGRSLANIDPIFLKAPALTPPTVSSFAPASGIAGATVTVNGSNLTGATAVTFNGTASTFTALSDSRIVATVPIGATTGPVAVTTDGGTSTSSTSFAVGSPTINSFAPSHGPAGTPVVITGTGLTGTTSVAFNGVSAAFTADSDTQITATVPAGATTGPIKATGPGGTGTTSGLFYLPPTITSMSPSTAGVRETVVLNGTNLLGTNSLAIAGLNAAFTVLSNTQISFTVPRRSTTGTARVTTPAGTTTSASPLTVLGPPTITSISPGSGPVGTPVTVVGTNLQDAIGVEIGSIITVPVSVALDGSHLTFTVPPGAASGTIRILARNGSTTSADTFTVTD